MRKNILFIAKFDNILKGMNKILSNNFNMQMCPPEPAIIEKTLDVLEFDLILLYISGLTFKLLYNLCGKLNNKELRTKVIVLGTSEECKEFDSYTTIMVNRYMHRPISAQDITKAIFKMLEDDPEEELEEAQPEIKRDMSIADFADSLEVDNRRCILLVDDDGRILRAMKMLLDKTYRINLANSGISALESIERERPDAVLLDYEMPLFDGKQTLEMIRKNDETRDLPVFFLTGVSDKDRIKEVIHLRPQGYLLKSSEQGAIVSMIENFFKNSGK